MGVGEFYYQYQGENIVYVIDEDQAKNSIGITMEDEVIKDYTLKVEGVLINIKECEIASTKQKRYYASFDYKETKYFLSGIMEQEEFEQILKNLYFPPKTR